MIVLGSFLKSQFKPSPLFNPTGTQAGTHCIGSVWKCVCVFFYGSGLGFMLAALEHVMLCFKKKKLGI